MVFVLLILGIQGIQHWKQFYANHKDYVRVGRVLHPPIDAESPIPEHCNKEATLNGEPQYRHKDQGGHTEL